MSESDEKKTEVTDGAEPEKVSESCDNKDNASNDDESSHEDTTKEEMRESLRKIDHESSWDVEKIFEKWVAGIESKEGEPELTLGQKLDILFGVNQEPIEVQRSKNPRGLSDHELVTADYYYANLIELGFTEYQEDYKELFGEYY